MSTYLEEISGVQAYAYVKKPGLWRGGASCSTTNGISTEEARHLKKEQ